MIINTLVGGASKKKYAQIKIACPAGVTLSLSNGKKSVEATTTQNPTYVYVPDAGTWNISGTWGKYNLDSSSSAVVTAPSTIVEATLTFKLYLYKPNDQCAAVTGGWKQLSLYGSLSMTSQGLKIASGGEAQCYYGCAGFNGSTLADFNSIKFTLKSVEKVSANTTAEALIAGSNSVPSENYPRVTRLASATLGSSGSSYTLGTHSIAIETIDRGYPMLYNYIWAYTISHVWLET